MFTSTQLRQQLSSINRKSYPAYKGLKGVYRFPDYLLSIDHVQGDPFASPSHVSISVSRKKAGFPDFCFRSPVTRIALQDLLTRKFEELISAYSFRAKGSGKSGLISITRCGQEVLERTACEIRKEIWLPLWQIILSCPGKAVFPRNL